MEATAQLEVLVARQAIHDQIVRFGRAMDDRDWGVLEEILSVDATAELGTGLLEGPGAIIALIRSYLEVCGTTQHFVGSVLIDVTGETATSRAYVRDLHLGAAGRDGLLFSTLGDYHDRWQRQDDSWRLRHRTKLNRGQVGTLEVFGANGSPP